MAFIGSVPGSPAGYAGTGTQTILALNPVARDVLDTSALNEAHKNHHDGDNQENMNKPSHRVGGNKPKKPENNKNNCK